MEKYKLRIEKNQADFVCAKARMIKAAKLIRTFGEAFDWSTFQCEMKILHAGSFINSSYFENFGQFDESFQIVGDYELLMRKGAKLDVDFIDEFLVEMGADGVSSALVIKSLKEVKRAKLKNKIRNPWQIGLDYYWVLFKIKVKQAIS